LLLFRTGSICSGVVGREYGQVRNRVRTGKFSSEMMVCWRVRLELEILTLFGFRKWKADMEDGVVEHPLIKEGAFEIEFDVLFIGVGGFDVEQADFV
jgi:hypothetical protein